jgi:hypothetical protein
MRDQLIQETYDLIMENDYLAVVNEVLKLKCEAAKQCPDFYLKRLLSLYSDDVLLEVLAILTEYKQVAA